MVLTEQSLADGRKYIPVPKACQVKECNNPIAASVNGSSYRIMVCGDHASDNRSHTTQWTFERCGSSNCGAPTAYILQNTPGDAWLGCSKMVRCQPCFDKMAIALTKPTEIVVDGVTYVRKP